MITPAGRRRPATRLLVSTRPVVGVIATVLVSWGFCHDAFARARDWMDLRRGGAPAIIASARQESALKPWSATYRTKLEAGHPLAPKVPGELTLTVARSPSAPAALGGTMLVLFRAPASLAGVGLVVQGGKAWLRLPGGKAVAATPKLLAQPLPGLDVPLIAFAPLEIAALHSAELEGEFEDTAMLRLKPEYTSGPDVPVMKAGVSKRWGVWTLGEVDDHKGQMLGLIEWLELSERQGQVVPAVLRLQPKSGNRAAVTLQLVTVDVGKVFAFSPKSLK